jgi:hypothetical protein
LWSSQARGETRGEDLTAGTHATIVEKLGTGKIHAGRMNVKKVTGATSAIDVAVKAI